MQNIKNIIPYRNNLIPMELTDMKCCLDAERKVTAFYHKINEVVQLPYYNVVQRSIMNHIWYNELDDS